MFGPVHELFRLIPRVSVLARQRRDEMRTGTTSWDTTDQYFELHALISLWQPNSNDETQNFCGTLLQQALLAYLAASFDDEAQDLNALNDYTLSIQSAFDTIIPIMNSIPPDSPLSTTLCWPLAILGSCARTGEHRDFVKNRLGVLSEFYASQSVKDTRSLLEKMWEDGAPRKANPLSFEDVMRREKMTVLFL